MGLKQRKGGGGLDVSRHILGVQRREHMALPTTKKERLSTKNNNILSITARLLLSKLGGGNGQRLKLTSLLKIIAYSPYSSTIASKREKRGGKSISTLQNTVPRKANRRRISKRSSSLSYL